MSVDIRSSERRRYSNEIEAREKEIAAGLLKVSQPASPKAVQENEKRIRREIANSNERRRMQCINAGFSTLRALIPQLDGEKVSKAAILQHTNEYITKLTKEKSRLQMQLDHSKRLLTELGHDRAVTDAYVSSSPPPSKRKKRDTESSDEGVGSLSDASDEGNSELQNENVTLRHQLESERQRCAALLETNRLLENQLLTMLQSSQASHPAQDLRTVHSSPHPIQHQESLYNREVVEVIGSREGLYSPPHKDMYEPYQPPRPLSPVPMETTTAADLTTSRRSHTSIVMESQSQGEPPHSPSPMVEYVEKRETSTPGLPAQVVPSVKPELSAVPTAAQESTTPAAAVVPSTASSDQHNYHHHHTYCHRDHPRRRHRQQRAEEEMRRQQQEQQQQQQQQQLQQQEMEMSASAVSATTYSTTTPAYRPAKHSTQNLEKLVEAIRQIEGGRVLCDEEGRMFCDDRKLYEEEHRLYDKRQSLSKSEESEREASSVSDQEDVKPEFSGRDSPMHEHHRHHHLQQQQHQQLTTSTISHQQLMSSPSHPSSSSPGLVSSITNNNSSSFSEKYPIATHLLHRPACYPGVIVHKQ